MRDVILASASSARQDMLRRAGLNFKSIPADIDEEALRLKMQKEKPEDIAIALAKEKSASIACNNSNSLVIGSDQLLVHNNNIINKASTKEEAKKTLETLQGKTHQLISAVSVYHGPHCLWQDCDQAQLTMKNLSNDEIDQYLNKIGDIAFKSVGCYQLENLGSWLFTQVKGDFFTILGMPLLSLLSFLQTQGISFDD